MFSNFIYVKGQVSDTDTLEKPQLRLSLTINMKVRTLKLPQSAIYLLFQAHALLQTLACLRPFELPCTACQLYGAGTW